MQKHTKHQLKVNFYKKDAFISDVCQSCLCVISDQTEIVKEKEYLRLSWNPYADVIAVIMVTPAPVTYQHISLKQVIQ